VPLETGEHHHLSLQKSPFGNEATKDSHNVVVSIEVVLMSPFLPLPCGPIIAMEEDV